MGRVALRPPPSMKVNRFGAWLLAVSIQEPYTCLRLAESDAACPYNTAVVIGTKSPTTSKIRLFVIFSFSLSEWLLPRLLRKPLICTLSICTKTLQEFQAGIPFTTCSGG